MLGFNSDQVYKDELGDLNKRATDIEFDTGDRFRQAWGMLIGKDYSKEGLLKGAAKIRNKELDDTYGARSKGIKLGPLTPEYQGAAGKTVDELDVALANDRRRADALEQGEATGYLDTTKLSPTASAGTILGLTNKGQRETDKRNEQELYDRRTEREDEIRAQDRERADKLLERQDIRQDRADARQDKRLAQDRRLTAETNQLQLQLQYAQLAQADRNRRQDRKDRAIMSIVSGLGNLGAAFAI